MHLDRPSHPPLPRLMSPAVRMALTACAAAGLTLVLYATMTGGARAGGPWDDPSAARVAVIVAMAAPLGWAWHRPRTALGVLLVAVAGGFAAGAAG